MKGPMKMKGMKGMSKAHTAAHKQGGGVMGGNMSGLSMGLSQARPKKAGRVMNLKKKMFGGGM